MKHIFFINHLEQLNIKKDSSLMMALTAKQMGHEVYLLLENDFYISNLGQQAHLTVYSFSGAFNEDGFYLSNLILENKCQQLIDESVIIHMRIDPPYDIRYQRYLWMLDSLRNAAGCKVINDPLGIMKYNEKLSCARLPSKIDSFYGSSEKGFIDFIEKIKIQEIDSVILKPMDLYSGIGVEKLAIDDSLLGHFRRKVKDFNGAIMAQVFKQEVYSGEVRSLF